MHSEAQAAQLEQQQRQCERRAQRLKEELPTFEKYYKASKNQQGRGAALAIPAAPVPPVPLTETHWVLIWAVIILGVAVTATGTTLAVIRWRRLHLQPPPPPPIPPHERARTRLRRLAASDLLETGAFADYYTELSETLREYLGGRFGFDSMDLTTTELTQRLKRVRLEGMILEEVVILLGDFDLVKFAKVEPTPDSARSALRQVEGLVEKTLARTTEGAS